MRTDLLLQLAEHLETLDEDTWHFNFFFSPCGTMACALGHCPDLWPNSWRVKTTAFGYRLIGPNNNFPVEGACDFFNIDYPTAANIFMNDNWFYGTGNNNVTKEMVAKEIRKLTKGQNGQANN